MINNSCCSFAKFCDTNGDPVISKMTIKNGVLIIENFNLDGTTNSSGLSFDSCPSVPVTNLIDLALRMNPLTCDKGQLKTNFSFEVQNNLAGIIDGTIITFDVAFNNSNYNNYEIEILDTNFNVINQNSIMIIDAGLFTGYINNIYIKYTPLSGLDTCNPVTVTMTPTAIYNVAPTYGTGNLAGDAKTKS